MCGGMRTMKKAIRVLAFLLGVFIVLSGIMLLSPVFDGTLNKVNGIVAFIFAFFVFRYAVKGV